MKLLLYLWLALSAWVAVIELRILTNERKPA